MPADAMILGFCAVGIYLWLCAVTPPLARAAKAVVRQSIVNQSLLDAWMAVALAIASGLLWTVVSVAVLFLWMMFEPGAGLVLIGTRLGVWAMAAGVTSWIAYAAASHHLPRIGRAFEIATVLSIVACVRDEPGTLRRVEQLYSSYAAPGPSPLA